MDDRFSNPQFETESFPKSKVFRFMGTLAFWGGAALLLMRNYAPELLDYVGGDFPELVPYSIIAMVSGSILNLVGMAMSKKSKALSGVTAESNLRVGGKDYAWNTSSEQQNANTIADTDTSLEEEDELDTKDLESDANYEEDGETEDSLLELHKSWKTSKIVSDTRGILYVLWPLCIFWNVISLPAAVGITKELSKGGQWGLVFIYLFPLFGLGFLFIAVRATLQYRRFGVSEFEIKDRMGRIGGALKGTIRSSVSVHPTGNFEVKLLCREQITTGSGKHRNTRTETRWEDRQLFSEQSHNSLNGIPVEFKIPSSCPESFDENTRGSVSWQLSISAPMKGVDYEAQFDVPVFRPRKQGAASVKVA